ncbi:MAG: hypothetical protein WDW38_007307 [Sanguina aurantia]
MSVQVWTCLNTDSRLSSYCRRWFRTAGCGDWCQATMLCDAPPPRCNAQDGSGPVRHQAPSHCSTPHRFPPNTELPSRQPAAKAASGRDGALLHHPPLPTQHRAAFSSACREGGVRQRRCTRNSRPGPCGMLTEHTDAVTPTR